MTTFRLQYFILIGILLFYFFENIWGVRFTTSDDSHQLLWAQHDIKQQFDLIDGIAKNQSRIYFYYHVWYLLYMHFFWDSIVYDIIQTSSLVISIILISYTLLLYTKNKHYLLYPLIYITLTPVVWEHSIITSIPLYHYVYIIKLCSILILIYKYTANPTKAKLVFIYIIFMFSIIGQEYQVFISILSVYIALLFARNRKYYQKIFYPLLLLSILYIIAAISFYYIYKSRYGGAEINFDSFNLSNFIGILVEWSISGNIIHQLLVKYELLIDYNFTTSMSENIYVFNNMQLDSKYFLFIIIIYYLLKSTDIWTQTIYKTGKLKLAISIYFPVVIMLPQFFLALTPKYQYWHRIGVESYTYTYLSNFVICICINYIISILLNKYSYTFKTIFFIFISSVFIINNAFSKITSESMKENTAKWHALNLFMQTPYAINNITIRAPRFAHRFWHTPNYTSYWNSLIQILYKKNIKLLIENNNFSSNTDKFIDYYIFDGNVYTLYGKLVENKYLHNVVLLSRENNNINYEYINTEGKITKGIINFKLSTNNQYIYEFNDSILFNTLRFHKTTLGGYIYPINNLISINKRFEFNNPNALNLFANNQNEWSSIENGAVWGYGSESNLYFSLENTDECLPLLEMTIEPIQTNDDSKITINVNDKISRDIWPDKNTRTYQIDLDKSIFGRNNNIKFINNFATIPRSIDLGNDLRNLSFRLYNFIIICN